MKTVDGASLGLGRLAGLALCALVTLAGCGGGDSSAPATLQSVEVTLAKASVAKGTSSQGTATAVYSDNTHTDVTSQASWSSSDTAVATVGAATGLVQSHAVGTASVTATYQSMSGNASVTVTPATVVSIAVTPPSKSLAAGTTQQFAATGTLSDGTIQDVSADVSWSSSDTAVGTVSATGLALAKAVGTSTITATCKVASVCGTVSGTATLTATAANLVSIAVTPASPSVPKGLTQAFTATGAYSDGTHQTITSSVTWASDNTAVATIGASTGVALAKAVGSAHITATSGNMHSPPQTLTVTAATLASIAITPATPSIAKGTTQQFTATGTYTDSTHQDLTSTVTWSSTNTGTATISNANPTNGLATSVAVGATTIGAALNSIHATGITLNVTAAALVSIQVTPASPNLVATHTLQFTATGTYTDASHQDLTATATWASDATGVATISNAGGSHGLATAAAGLGGTAHITATSGVIVSPQDLLTVRANVGSAYVTNSGAATVSQYTIGPDGSLAAKGTPTVDSGGEPSCVVVDPTDSYAYVSNFTAGTISQYTIGADGSLSPATGAPTIGSGSGVGSGPTKMAVSGTYLYVANYNDGTVSQFSIGGGGALSSIGADIAAGTNPYGVTVDPSGSYVYVANFGSDDISQYSIGGGGVLTSLGTSVSPGVGSAPRSVAVDPSSQYLYTANSGTDDVSQFAITAGVLATTPTATVGAGGTPWFITLDPSGQYVYVANNANSTISEYSLGAGGALNSIGTAQVNTIPDPTSSPYALAIDQGSQYLFVAGNSDNETWQFTIASGDLTQMGTPNVPAGSGPTWVAISEPK